MQTTLNLSFSEKLSPEEIKQLEQFGTVRHYNDDELVYGAGSRDVDLFVVLTGAIEVTNPTDSGFVLMLHEPGEFSGDIDLLTGRQIICNGRAKGKSEILRIPNASLNEVMLRVPSFSEKMYTAFMDRRNALNKLGKAGLKVMGPARCKATTLIREFLYKNFVPFIDYDNHTDEGHQAWLDLGSPQNLPIVQCNDGNILTQPTLIEIAQAAGIWRHCPNYSVDLAIVGAGPAGIAAAVYASSEGLSTLVLDRVGPGGQAGGSSKIENFIGFPSGLSGADLATRGVLQMLKFGANLVAPVEVRSIGVGEDGRCSLPLDCGAVISARVVLIAAGVVWKKLEARNADRFERAGVYYACTTIEATLHDQSDVAVVGGGNSAGQAAMYLSECCPSRTVHMVLRSTLGPSMSDYLTNRIRANPRIVVHEHTTIEALNGDMQIESADFVTTDGVRRNIRLAAVFVFIGAVPSHPWLPESIARDENGFPLAGIDAFNSGKWPLKDRTPCPLETTMPNVLVAGDIRSGSTKRVGFAVGDGSQAVTCVHFLNAL